MVYDKDPKHFGLILNYLRNNYICSSVLPTARNELEELYDEVKYYQLDKLKKKIRSRVKKESGCRKYSDSK